MAAARLHLIQIDFPADWLYRHEIETQYKDLADQPIPEHMRDPAASYFFDYIQFAAEGKLREWTR